MRRQVAVIGASWRLPGCGRHDLWTALTEGADLIGRVAGDRWAQDAWLHPSREHPGTSYTFAAGSIGDVWGFDAGFFGISPREAAAMDPQQRLLLELAWEALEDAGVSPDRLARTDCGVYIGIASNDNAQRAADDIASIGPTFATGNTTSIAANRISYVLDLRGPSMAVDTACSSSLVAFHQACESIRHGESGCALAGGASLHLHPYGFVAFSKASMLSPDGRIRPFDAEANGYVRSEGGGIFLLKDLERALADGDRILAVVAGSAVNTDGAKQGLTIPSCDAQADLLEQAYARAGIEPDAISYLEAHGTGTPVGDPIEAAALGQALGQRRSRPLPIGSVKGNLGHLEAAAGVAGLAKALLVLDRRQIPPTIGLRHPNPNIPFERLGVEVVQELTQLPASGSLTVGVNSFGFGGANAHVILRSPPEPDRVENRVEDGVEDGVDADVAVAVATAVDADVDGDVAADAPPREADLPLFLSAPDPEGLRAVAATWAEYLEARADADLYPIAWGARFRRQLHRDGLVLFAATPREAARHLREHLALDEGESRAEQAGATVHSGRRIRPARGPAFLYSGNGCQWEGMGRALLSGSSVFRSTVSEVDSHFATRAGFSLASVLAGESDLPGYDRTEIAQPALFALQVGMTEVLRAHGIEPVAVAGHSVGEVAAAWATGALSLEQAARVIHERSRLQGTTRGSGEMTAVAAPASTVSAWIERMAPGAVHVAGINSSRGCTIAGDPEQLARIEALANQRLIRWRRLGLAYAFHTPAMEVIEHELRGALGDLAPGASRIPFHSAVTGERCAGERLDAAYWWRNVREPVRFADAVESLLGSGVDVLVEVGAHPILAGYVRDAMRERRQEGLVIPTGQRDRDDHRDLNETIGATWLSGADCDLTRWFPRRAPFVPLPSYPWQRRLHRPVATGEATGSLDRHRVHPLLGYRLPTPSTAWENQLDAGRVPWLDEHRVDDSNAFPAAGFVEVVLAAAARVRADEPFVEIADVEILTPLVLDDANAHTLRSSIDSRLGTVRITGRRHASLDPWVDHVRARVAEEPSDVGFEVMVPPPPERAPDFGRQDLLAATRAGGLDYGPTFRRIERGWREGDRAIGIFEHGLDGREYLLHPGELDSALQLVIMLLAEAPVRPRDRVYLPTRFERIRVRRDGGPPAYVETRLRRRSPRSIVLDVTIAGADHRPLALLSGVRLRAIELRRRAAPRIDHVVEHLVPVSGAGATDATVGAARDHAGRQWLILSDASSRALSEHLLAELAARGHDPHILDVGDAERIAAGLSATPAPDEILHLHGLTESRGGPAPAPAAGQTADMSIARAVARCAAVARAVGAAAAAGATPRHWLVTHRASAAFPAHASGDELVQVPPDVSTWGFGRSLLNELGAGRVRLVDVATTTPSGAATGALLDELLAPSPEWELLVDAQGSRSAPRMQVIAPPEPDRTTQSEDIFELGFERPGQLADLRWQRREPVPPAGDKVEVDVHATGLNFRDVMYALGMLQDEALENGFGGPTLGLEFAGRVIRTGEAVDDLSPGDAVVGFGPASFATRALAPRRAIARVPRGMDLTEAASIPSAFFTAYYALHHLARLQRGERVLIHGAAGGVGMAAVQIAQWLGAEIHATASTPEKHEVLRALGVEHLYDSRSLRFADEIRASSPGGRGVDVVLNSLAGEAIRRNLQVLEPMGRFLELGKRDFYADTPIGLRPFRNNISYFGVDVDQLMVERPELTGRLFAEMLALFEQGALRPLPVTRFHAEQVEEAFRHMQQARHVGKIVVTYEGGIDPARVSRRDRPRLQLSPDATWLVTGGLSGFGLRTARWLVERGVRHIVLASRSGPGPDHGPAMAALERDGAVVMAAACDVGERESLTALLQRLRDELPPLRGIVHAAVVYENAVAETLEEATLRRSFHAKARGAWLLHELTAEDPIEHFVLFSSGTTLLGGPGQGAYVAANRWGEALAVARRAADLPATCVCWGAIEDAGALADDTRTRALLEARLGGRAILATQALDELERLLLADASGRGVFPVDLAALERSLPAAASPRFGELPRRTDAGGSDGAKIDLAALVAALPEHERVAAVTSLLRPELARILLLEADAIDADRPLQDLGMDSLMGIELTSAIEARLGVTLPTLTLSASPTLHRLAAEILRRVTAPAAASGGRDSAQPLRQV